MGGLDVQFHSLEDSMAKPTVKSHIMSHGFYNTLDGQCGWYFQRDLIYCPMTLDVSIGFYETFKYSYFIHVLNSLFFFFYRNLPLYSVRATSAKLMYSGSIRAVSHQPALLLKVQCQANTELEKYYSLCFMYSSYRRSIFRQHAAWKVGSCVQDLNFNFCLINWNYRNNSVGKTEPSSKLHLSSL